MPKLQRIKRANGSLVYSVNIPLEIIEELEWEKGSKLFLEIQEGRKKPGIIIFREEEEVNEKEEEKNGSTKI